MHETTALMPCETTAPSLGNYRGRDIPAWIVAPHRGGRMAFVGIATEDQDGAVPLAQLATNEVVICPGLIYRLEAATNV